MSDMLRRKEAFTIITPIPGFIPRQLAIDILHAHSEVINVNPLVLGHKPISAPRDAAADEFYSTWYEIEERVQVVPGMGKFGSSKIKFNGCFHDMPWGLQTHIYAPLNIDLRNTYRIGGNQPGLELPEVREIGLETLGVPADGLYLRDDVEIKCNVTMVSFVKAQVKAASKEMVQRIIKKAELLDAGVLKAMMEDGRLKTVNPNDRSMSPDLKRRMSSQGSSYSAMRPLSPQLANTPSFYTPSISPSMSYATYNNTAPADLMYQVGNPYQHSLYAATPPPVPPKEQMMIMELPGDFPTQQPSPGLHPPPAHHNPGWNRDSVSSSDPRWSQSQPSPSYADSQRMSMSSVSTGTGAHPGFATELAAHSETKEEHQDYRGK